MDIDTYRCGIGKGGYEHRDGKKLDVFWNVSAGM